MTPDSLFIREREGEKFKLYQWDLVADGLTLIW